MSRKKLIPVLFEVNAINGFAFLLLVSISKFERFFEEVYQIHRFGMHDIDRLLICTGFVCFMILAAGETAKRPQAGENGSGSKIALFIWAFGFCFLLSYERGRFFPLFCNYNTALLYVTLSVISFMMAFIHLIREKVRN